MEKEKNLDYWKKNAEENYMQVPISVLRYIGELESRVEALSQHDVIKSLPDSDEIRMKARELDEKDFDQWWWETVYKGTCL